MSIILPIVIFVSWFAFVLVPAGRLAIEDEQNNVPKDKRRGTSILPGFPIFPLIGPATLNEFRDSMGALNVGLSVGEAKWLRTGE